MSVRFGRDVVEGFIDLVIEELRKTKDALDDSQRENYVNAAGGNLTKSPLFWGLVLILTPDKNLTESFYDDFRAWLISKGLEIRKEPY